jgi:formylglycine-generating enzyme required for sulfatase activity
VKFCERTGLDIPTLHEWRHAARAGSTGEYCFGDDAQALRQFANFDWPGSGHTLVDGVREVGAGLPNAFGLFDVHGNLGELTLPAGSNAQQSTRAIDDRASIPVAGGSYFDPADWCTLDGVRDRVYPGARVATVGFRPILRITSDVLSRCRSRRER